MGHDEYTPELLGSLIYSILHHPDLELTSFHQSAKRISLVSSPSLSPSLATTTVNTSRVISDSDPAQISQIVPPISLYWVGRLEHQCCSKSGYDSALYLVYNPMRGGQVYLVNKAGGFPVIVQGTGSTNTRV